MYEGAAGNKKFPAAYIFYMEYSYNQIRKMCVVSVSDGKNLGRVCDLTFTPEGCILGFFVTGSKGFHLTKSDQFIPFKKVMRIGEDVILVKGEKSKEDDCPPKNACQPCPPPCPPKNVCQPCPPPCPPKSVCQPCPPHSMRNFDDYE